MWRAFFLAIGICLGLLGAECLVVEKVVLTTKGGASPPGAAKAVREIRPPEWAPWTLLSSGAVIILYSFTIPRRSQK